MTDIDCFREKKMFRLYRLLIILLVFVIGGSLSVAYSQGSIEVHCGEIVTGEFTTEYEEQRYAINLGLGDEFMVTGRSFERSGLLSFTIVIYKPDDTWLVRSGEASESPYVESGVLFAQGAWIFTAINYDTNPSGSRVYTGERGGVGVYTLYIGCTLRDGTVIEPSDALPQETSSSTSLSTALEVPAFSGVGFPGLAPVDFSTVARVPMLAGTPMTGAITPTGGEILGYTLNASADDVLDLTFTRLSGNLNLGLVVLWADNQVVFQASLVTSETLSTRFTLPSAGQYTIGVFRIDLLPPAAPEATAFQLQATLNP